MEEDDDGDDNDEVFSIILLLAQSCTYTNRRNIYQVTQNQELISGCLQIRLYSMFRNMHHIRSLFNKKFKTLIQSRSLVLQRHYNLLMGLLLKLFS
jgi:hypothetical protein